MTNPTVAVIGGGASGMMAALTAAKNGSETLLIERQSRVGRKLLATGNGRCNLTNLNCTIQNYHGDRDFAAPALAAFGPQETIDFFRTLGLLCVCQGDGRVYPLSDQAGSVVDVLRFALDAAGVQTITGAEVTGAEQTAQGFRLRCSVGDITCQKLIVSCGGLAGTKLGGSKWGYDLLSSFGHSVTKLYPSLVQLRTDNSFVRSLKGVRADGAIKVQRAGETMAATRGEIQFTDYGVSGPAVFEISRFASPGDTLIIDLLPDYTQEQVSALLEGRISSMPGLTLENLFTGMLHNRLGRTIARWTGLELSRPLPSLSRGELALLSSASKAFTLPVLGPMGFDSAQVTAGGVSCGEFDKNTLQSLIIPGLYACGEVLDMDGDCGGYNLQWAWASGRLAGMTK